MLLFVGNGANGGYADNALFIDAMNHMGDNIANAVIPQGLDPSNVGLLIVALNTHNQTAVAAIPGITPEIIGSGVAALLDTFVVAFRHVWIAAACFVGLATVGSSNPSPSSLARVCLIVIGLHKM
jgi:hypothetical protein